MINIILDADDIIDENHANLIVCHPTGILYTVQAAGIGCQHPRAEGFVIPWELWEGDLDCELICCNQIRKENLIKTIDKLNVELKKIDLVFDETRWKMAMENWIPVIAKININADDWGGKKPFTIMPMRCWYCAGNCD